LNIAAISPIVGSIIITIIASIAAIVTSILATVVAAFSATVVSFTILLRISNFEPRQSRDLGSK
jgi:hypothetical protein